VSQERHQKESSFIHESKKMYFSSVVSCALLWGEVQTIMASGFSLLGMVRRPINNIYIYWNGVQVTLVSGLSLHGRFERPSDSMERFIGFGVQATICLP